VSVDALELSPFASRRVPLLLQTEAAECALACLAMVAGAHGHRTDLATLRQRFSLSLKGATLADLVRMAGELQFNSRALRVEPEQLEQLALPCILHWDLNHFVVLADLRGGVATLHDPARGVRRMSLAELSRHFTGVALELTPAADFSPRIERQSVRLPRADRAGAGPEAFAGADPAAGAGAGGLRAAEPVPHAVGGGRRAGQRRPRPAADAGRGLRAAGAAPGGTAALRSWAVLHLSATLNLQWLGNVFAHLMRLPVAWFEKRHAGDVWSRFASVQQIQKTLTTQLRRGLIDGLLVVLTLAMMAFYSLALTAVALAAVAVYALLRWAFFRPLREATRRRWCTRRSRPATSWSRCAASRRSSCSTARPTASRASCQPGGRRDERRAQPRASWRSLGSAVLHRLLFGVERVAVVWVGALAGDGPALHGGHAVRVLRLQGAVRAARERAHRQGVELRMLRLQGERLADIVLTAAPEDMGVPRLSERPLEAGIELRGVSLPLRRRRGRRAAWREPADRAGRVGGHRRSVGLRQDHAAQDDAGHPRAAGWRWCAWAGCRWRAGLSQWRSMVGTVMQDDTLFSGSVADNICFFDAVPDLDWMVECARMAAVHDEIEAMPMGYHTLVGEWAPALSGGQKQRLLLARALYKRPRVLLLDEATSSLDVERERQVNQAMRQLELTRVIVAHRPETIASASRVVVLQDGRVSQDLRSVPGAGRV
jgi:ATP-binding cassette subfamily B protein RaxB